jgi:hypothetical protein
MELDHPANRADDNAVMAALSNFFVEQRRKSQEDKATPVAPPPADSR